MSRILVYTDGSCFPNPGHAGWAYIVPDQGIERHGYMPPPATNNHAEMMAVIMAMEELPRGILRVHSDSQYVVNGLNTWIRGWKARGWRTGAGDAVKNIDLWKRMDAARSLHVGVEMQWVRGHNGHEHNERCDVLAGEARIKGFAP